MNAAHLRRHIYGGLTVCIYHGRGRETNPEVLAKADIVLTTYHTVAAEGFKNNSALFRIKWFRVVLDEGMITLRILNFSYGFRQHYLQLTKSELYLQSYTKRRRDLKLNCDGA